MSTNCTILIIQCLSCIFLIYGIFRSDSIHRYSDLQASFTQNQTKKAKTKGIVNNATHPWCQASFFVLFFILKMCKRCKTVKSSVRSNSLWIRCLFESMDQGRKGLSGLSLTCKKSWDLGDLHIWNQADFHHLTPFCVLRWILCDWTHHISFQGSEPKGSLSRSVNVC